MGIFDNLCKVLSIMTKADKKRLWVVLFLAIIMGVIEVIGVGSIMPFMSVASNPSLIHSNQILSTLFSFLKFSNDATFIIFLGIGVIGFLLLTNTCNALMNLAKLKFTSIRRHTIGLRLLRGYLSMDYQFFLNRGSHEFLKNIQSELPTVINSVLLQFVDLIIKSIQVLLLSVFLLIIDPISTCIIALGIFIIYSLIFRFTKRVLSRLSVERYHALVSSSKILSEAFWGIKDVKITGTESIFSDMWAPASKKQAECESLADVIGDMPKYVLETVAFSGMMLLVLSKIVVGGDFSAAVSRISLFGYAAYRLIPAVQAVFRSVTRIRSCSTQADMLAKEFKLFAENTSTPYPDTIERMPFDTAISLKNISFGYESSTIPVLSGLSLEIKANTLVGFAGKTGSGKTTTIDLILGLLQQQKGSLEIDGMPVTPENMRSWQKNIGYVPQTIFLSDSSIAENIAFGVPAAKIDYEAVKRSAELAQIKDFIEQELSEGYQTKVGERGVRLSGGQRQRIGIARALYRNPSVLIMDEATSALDNQTERAVMDSIDSLQGSRTILLIAHRLSTLKKCDSIYVLEKGKIIEQGSYAELLSDSSYFNT